MCRHCCVAAAWTMTSPNHSTLSGGLLAAAAAAGGGRHGNEDTGKS